MWVEGLGDAWPEGWQGKRVVVTGNLSTRPGVSQFEQGVTSPHLVLAAPQWRLAAP